MMATHQRLDKCFEGANVGTGPAVGLKEGVAVVVIVTSVVGMDEVEVGKTVVLIVGLGLMVEVVVNVLLRDELAVLVAIIVLVVLVIVWTIPDTFVVS